VEGSFAIVVTASKDGSTGRAEVRESNTLAGGVTTPGSGGGHRKLILALVGVLASAGAGAAVAGMKGSKSGGSTGAAAVTPTTLSVGAVTIGGPR
jgi:hypothetical protein